MKESNTVTSQRNLHHRHQFIYDYSTKALITLIGRNYLIVNMLENGAAVVPNDGKVNYVDDEEAVRRDDTSSVSISRADVTAASPIRGSRAVVVSLACAVVMLIGALVTVSVLYSKSESGNDEPDTDTNTATPLAIVGKYKDEWGSKVIITNTALTTMYAPDYKPHHVNITHVDNDLQFFVGINTGEASFYPNAYSRVDWVGGKTGPIAYCFSNFNAATEHEAIRDVPIEVYDESKWNTTGCAGFPFTKLLAEE